MVRGVSDLADEHKGSADVEKWRSYACDAAASFAIALLKSGPVHLLTEKPPPPPPPELPCRVQVAIAVVVGLLILSLLLPKLMPLLPTSTPSPMLAIVPTPTPTITHADHNAYIRARMPGCPSIAVPDT